LTTLCVISERKMAYKMRITESEAIGKSYLSPLTGETECVAFIQQTTGAPITKLWKKGSKIAGAISGSIPSGTAIATFDAMGNYPTDTLGKHAAIYLTHDLNCIKVLDQWAFQGKVLKRPIWFNRGPKRSNDGNSFYVIE
jgi:hypothetical protein